MWGGIVQQTGQAVISICAWCPDARQQERDATAAGQQISHGICAACSAEMQAREVMPIAEVRAWGNRLLASMAMHRHRCAQAGLPGVVAGIEWAIAELDGSLVGLLDGVGPRR